ncbi:alpha-D-ribose 1-methylphosphonate 5-triphosphate diphosphatase [Desulfosarcina sp. BuS5]|uniref:alpha-D-ribose 1-methylphosphonate 5-triphosphate diphosphatase n=1 Tax=Desulfosarcina sp. BuS5 TaxID=933262 RepID=UPI000484CB8C|nr:alpha-D-ribose 1-methylphosphonate 5-triphosphate diphosphatase [Desulfosarcina sp. BuS5]WDN89847.1 alpha-D-ribose 1-methylphosphonate 5-triphosphate diphosphatase [Desulfosarcina sp. BuS5]
MKNKNFIIENASISTPAGIVEKGSCKVENGIISRIIKGRIESNMHRINAKGAYLLPGFIDLHSDALEKEIEPRPNTYFPINIALLELDKKLASCGVTTIFHAISFAEGEIGVRSNKMAANVINEINRLKALMCINVRVHARFEITDHKAVAYLEDSLKAKKINLLSFMDHTPGQGQFKKKASFKAYFGNVYKKNEAEIIKIIDKKIANEDKKKSNMDYLANLCRSLKITMASHDDDTTDKIDRLKIMGITISEFPVNQKTAKAALDKGFHVCLGAPNVLRGISQTQNLNARKAIMAGYGDILASDYAPMTLLHAVFTIFKLNILPLHEAVNMVSINPARAAGIINHTGSLDKGKEADILLVDALGEIPRILKTFVSGKEVFSTC